MRRMAGRAPFSFERRVFVREWTLLVGVTLDASRIRAGGQPGLFEFETTVRIVAIATLHGSFENLMMERRTKLRLYLTMTTYTELRLTDFQHVEGREVWLLSIRFRHKDI